MSRYHLCLLATILTGVFCLATHRLDLYIMVVAGLVTLTMLGALFPKWRFFGPILCRGGTARRETALTFDDGPDARSTPALLDLLREEKIPAAFFCVGKKVAAERELTARILREGHLVENHSFSHSNLINLFTAARLRTELVQTQQAIQSAAGRAPECFRPPMGMTNPRTFRVTRELGLKMVGWSARGLDTQQTNPERIVARILRQLQPGGIILLHDGNIPAERLVVTVRLLLASLRQRGYEVVRLDHLLK